MCGLIGALGASEDAVRAALGHVRHRGPDGEGVRTVGRAVLGHTRLSVIDVSEASDQPFEYRDLVLTYNGELWNYRELRAALIALGHDFRTTGDTEVVAAALAEWGVDAYERMDGMWAVAWVDDGTAVHLARDRFGEIPLHVGTTNGSDSWWGSELKALRAVGAGNLWDVGPGERVRIDGSGIERTRWYEPSAEPDADATLEKAAIEVLDLLKAGTVERGLAADVPVCTLLSGGIDSAAVAAHLMPIVDELVAYTAVLDPKSRDLRCARETAEWLAIPLVEVAIAPPTADDLARTVAAVEMPHKAQVEIGWACLALADRMRHDGFKVTFSGEGSDELWASYGFAHHGIEKEGWHEYRKHLFLDQARKNFARCNKVFMAHSVEVRLPFLHRPLVERALALPRDAVQDGRSRPKAVLQRGHVGLVPDEVATRAKVAFQDGMGLKAACADAVASPAHFYRSEFARLLA